MASAVEPITLERAAVARNALLNTDAFFPIILIAGSMSTNDYAYSKGCIPVNR